MPLSESINPRRQSPLTTEGSHRRSLKTNPAVRTDRNEMPSCSQWLAGLPAVLIHISCDGPEDNRSRGPSAGTVPGSTSYLTHALAHLPGAPPVRLRWTHARADRH